MCSNCVLEDLPRRTQRPNCPAVLEVPVTDRDGVVEDALDALLRPTPVAKLTRHDELAAPPDGFEVRVFRLQKREDGPARVDDLTLDVVHVDVVLARL